MGKMPLSTVKVPKIKLKKVDWSKWNFRKFNWNTILAIMSYLHILVLVPLFAGKKSKFVTFHAGQGLRLLVVWVLFMFTFFVPVLAWIIGFYILINVLIGIINVSMGKEKALPLIGK